VHPAIDLHALARHSRGVGSLSEQVMSTQAPILEHRRGERVLIRVPVEVRIPVPGATAQVQQTETTVVSRHGALIRLNAPPQLGSTLEIINKFTQQSEQFRVAWISEDRHEDGHDTGVEMLAVHNDFWGIQFPVKSRRA
jgi:hypothetical protein